MNRHFEILDVQQRSKEWRLARAGRLTSSRADDMLAKTQKNEWRSSRRNLLMQLVLERLTNKSHESSYVSAAMQQGIDREADALLLYEALTGQLVERTGFLSVPTLMVGCSLDGHVNDFEGVVETKCPIPATHLDYLRTGRIPLEYFRQIQHQLWITRAAWCDFMSFNPDFPEALQAKIIRVTRADAKLEDYHLEAVKFLEEVNREVDALSTMFDLSATLWAAVGARA